MADNAIMTDLAASIPARWLFGIFVISLTLFVSLPSNSTSGVLLITSIPLMNQKVL